MVESLLHPNSIAVVGVSIDPQKVGHQIFANLLSFPGTVIPINPNHKQVLGKKAYPNLLMVPDAIDLVVIATPMNTVEGIVDECIDKKVRGVVIISAGFAEDSKQGKVIQDRIVKKLTHNHIALLGPNTLGVVNPWEKLNASFAPKQIEKGSVALISQSGAMLTTIFAEFASRGVGCAFALSLGNSAGVTAIEALEYAYTDPHTKVIALYLESVPRIEEFFILARKVSKQKPIIFLKGGLSEEGQRASLSHTAALATNATLLTHAQHQMGYTMVSTIEQFFETTFFLDSLLQKPHRNLPTNVMILTNAGGPGVNSVDLASKESLELASWSQASLQRFSRELPRVRPQNPTDLLGDATVIDIQKALVFAEEDPMIESILLIITPQAVTDVEGITEMLLKHHVQKPLIVALMGGEGQHRYIRKLRDSGITAVEYANEGIEILSYVNRARKATLVDRSATLMRQLEHTLPSQIDNPIDTRQEVTLQSTNLEEVLILLERYNLTLPRCAIVASTEQLDELDGLDPERVYPLIAKTTNLQLKHKATVGGVIKDINSKSDATRAFTSLQKLGSRMILQEVIEDAQELIVGAKRDPQFGPFVAVGSGGSLTNIIDDRSYLFLPASQREVRQAFKQTKIFATLSAEQRSLVLLTLERFIRLFTEHPEISEIEINPLMVTKHQAYVADIKVEMKVV